MIATGSEVEIAHQAQIKLENLGIGARLISMPCIEIFDKQPREYIDDILKNGSIKVVIEAGTAGCWYKYIGSDGVFIGMNSFGESAPYKELYNYFGITPENIVKTCLEKLQISNR